MKKYTKDFKKKKEYKNGLLNITQQLGGLSNIVGQAPVQNLNSTYYSTRYDLYTLRRDNLNNRYATDGIFRTLVEQPVLDATRGDLEIESDLLSADEIEQLKDRIDKKNIIDVLNQKYIWDRLFGGAGLIIEVENQSMDLPLTFGDIQQGDEVHYYAIDRWELSNSANITANQIETRVARADQQLYYFGVKINNDRIVLSYGTNAPSLIRPRLMGWGLSVCEPLIAPSNTYQKALNLVYELIDESKIDVYKLQDFKNSVIAGEDETVIDRVQLSNMLKNYSHALLMDKEDDYEQKQLNLQGVVDILHEIKLDICSAMKMPMTKIWGLSPAGFSTGDSDIKNYNMMVESEVRPKIYRDLRKILKIECKCMFGIAPVDLKVSFPNLDMPDQATLDQSKDREFARLKSLYDSKLLTSQELGEALKQNDILTMKTKMVDGSLPEFSETQPEQDYTKLDL